MYRRVYRTLPMRGLMSLNDSKELETWNFMDIYTIELKPQPHFQASLTYKHNNCFFHYIRSCLNNKQSEKKNKRSLKR